MLYIVSYATKAGKLYLYVTDQTLEFSTDESSLNFKPENPIQICYGINSPDTISLREF